MTSVRISRKLPQLTVVSLLTVALLVTMILASPTRAMAEVQFTVTGGGWGHGIGMSQWGAAGYAAQGKTYDWILAHYYTGSRLVAMSEPTVKVNLDSTAAGRASWRIMSGSSTALTVSQTTSSGVAVTLDPAHTYWIVTVSGNTHVAADASTTAGHRPGTVLKYFSGGCSVSGGGYVQIVSASGPFSHTNVVWRGSLRFIPTSTTASLSKAVNYVAMEQYLYGVVPRELGSSFPAEALKAQAVAARSYAWQDAYEGNTLYCTTMSQVYNGRGRWNSTHTGSITLHEATSTNNAVNATAAKVLWYGTEAEPIQTFFSSSTGGSTASIQDVWTGSTPKPYYTSVVDADQASPDFAWAKQTLSGTAFATALRDKDNGSSGTDPLEYSAPAPAVVTGISVERAASGFVRYATVRWSNGASFRISGTTLQSAMRFKSTKFYITASSSLTPNRYQQYDRQIRTVGSWSTLNGRLYAGGSQQITRYKGRYKAFKFYGTGFRWVGSRGSRYGRAAVYVDGVRKATVSQYSASSRYQQSIWSVSGLSAGKAHTVVIKVLGTKDSRALSTNVSIDAVDITGGSLLPPYGSRFESTAARTTGSWSNLGATWTSGRSYLYTESPDAQMTFSFTGAAVRLVGTRHARSGGVNVSLDGGPWRAIDLYSPDTLFQATLWDSGRLASGAHRLTVKPTGYRNPASSGNAIAIDAFDVRTR